MNRDELQATLQRLLVVTSASRVTARIDDNEHGWNVDDVVAEALEPGQMSLVGMTAINQRAADTARRIEHTRTLLVQDDVSSAIPRPPAALVELYGVQAQVLAPIQVGGEMVGWLSVHDCAHTHAWTADEQAAIAAAAATVEAGWPVEPVPFDERR